MPLFVVLREGATLDETLKEKIKGKIQQDISPRHVPNAIFAVPQIPKTLIGKKMELPVRKILLGQPVEQAANPDAMSNPESIQFFVDLAREIRGRSK
jgi:acetoacetyl-CoA synthetase